MTKAILFTLCYMVSAITTSVQFSDRKTPIPLVRMIYPKGGTPFDRGCGEFLGKAADQNAINEVADRLEEFQKRWDQEGTMYISTVLEEVRIPFPYCEIQATLTVCDIASVSSPLIINVRRFLSSAENPLPPWAFSEIVFHEVMHTYVRAVYNHSELLRKYAAEPVVVRNHLHEMALEKLVLVRLKKHEMLTWLDDRYRNKFPPAYKRAWEIVSDIEGYERFVDELKSMPDISN